MTGPVNYLVDYGLPNSTKFNNGVVQDIYQYQCPQQSSRNLEKFRVMFIFCPAKDDRLIIVIWEVKPLPFMAFWFLYKSKRKWIIHIFDVFTTMSINIKVDSHFCTLDLSSYFLQYRDSLPSYNTLDSIHKKRTKLF